MAKLKKIFNGEYIGGDKYIISDAGSGKSKIIFAPDSVLKDGTAIGAEILNEMQLNAIYNVDTTRVMDGQKEVYTANLEGYTEFENPNLNLTLKINTTNSTSNVFLRLNNIDYQFKNCGIKNLVSGRFVNVRKDNGFIYILEQEKTDSPEENLKLFTALGAFNLNKIIGKISESLTEHISTLADTLKNGHMSKEDKIKLDSIAENANNYTLPVATNSSLGGIKIGSGINISADGTISVAEVKEGLVPPGAMYLTVNSQHPALTWPGTTWEAVQNRMLVGAGGSYSLGATGGSSTKALTVNNLPRHRFQVDSFSLGRGNMNITGTAVLNSGGENVGTTWNGALYTGQGGSNGRASGGVGKSAHNIQLDASRSWTGTTTSAAPYTGYVGNNEAFNIMNPYLAVNIWNRLS